MTGARPFPRVVAAAALTLAVIVTAVIVLTGSGGYVIHARFFNAEGLVTGGRVEVAGRQVGSIGAIGLSRDGLANVDLSIDDGSLIPLHVGTRAAIRTVGQAGLANRFVELTPGPAAQPLLPDGAVLSTTQTSSVVDIDALLDSFGPANRAQLQELIARSADIYAGSGARSFQAMLARFAPAARQLAAVTREVDLDRVALGQLVDTAARASAAIATRRDDLASAVRNMALSFGSIADQRTALSDLLTRAPTVLDRATGTLGRIETAVTALRPALREIPPAGAPLRAFLARTGGLLHEARPTLALLATEMPQLGAGLSGLLPLAAPLIRALGTTAASMQAVRHILRGVRLYGSDLILGVFSGLVGVSTGSYDSLGHYAKDNLAQNLQTAISGPLANLLQQHPLVPGLLGSRTGLTRRCPGGLSAPTPDGSSPWVLGSALCSPKDDIPASVNQP